MDGRDLRGFRRNWMGKCAVSVHLSAVFDDNQQRSIRERHSRCLPCVYCRGGTVISISGTPALRLQGPEEATDGCFAEDVGVSAVSRRVRTVDVRKSGDR